MRCLTTNVIHMLKNKSVIVRRIVDIEGTT
jgi:hypothetical protein